MQRCNTNVKLISDGIGLMQSLPFGSAKLRRLQHLIEGPPAAASSP